MKAFHFLSRQFCFIFLLMFSLAQVGWGAGAPAGGAAAAAGVVGADSPFNADGSLKRIAAIQILPYDPLREDGGADYHVDKCETPEGYSSMYSEYRDHFGFGRNCVYHVPETTDFESKVEREAREAREAAGPVTLPVSSKETGEGLAGAGVGVGGGGDGAVASPHLSADEESGGGAGAAAGGTGKTAAPPVTASPPPPPDSYYAPGTHGYYLEHLARYKESLKGLKAVESGYPFANGNYLLVRVDILTGSVPKNYIFGVFASGESKIFDAFPLEQLRENLEPKNLMYLVGKRARDGNVPKPFSLVDVEKEELEKVDKTIKKAAESVWPDVLDLLKSYIYEERVYPVKLFCIGGKVLPPYALTSDEEILERTLFFIEEKFSLVKSGDSYEAKRKNRKLLLRRLFGETVVSRMFIRKSCSPIKEIIFPEVEKARKEVFEQSEQAFLNFLSKAGTDLRSLHSFPEVTTLEGTFGASVYFYSTKDICRYCRGTLAYLLSNDQLKKGLEKVFQEDPAFHLDKINMYAFSFDQTDV